MSSHFRFVLLAIAPFVLAGSATAAERQKDDILPAWFHSSVTFENSSKLIIYHIFISSTDDGSWGPDQLGSDTLAPSESIKFTGINCDDYDIKLVDMDGDACILEDIDLCLEDAEWELTTKDLLICQGWGI